jgi:hypothetical protein
MLHGLLVITTGQSLLVLVRDARFNAGPKASSGVSIRCLRPEALEL